MRKHPRKPARSSSPSSIPPARCCPAPPSRSPASRRRTRRRRSSRSRRPIKASRRFRSSRPDAIRCKAEFSGFETRMLPDVRVRSGNNKQVLMLPIEGHKETVLVGQDKQAAAADPRGSSFGTTLTREQLANLSDDPEVLRQQLMDMAGPGAVIRVDSFEGAALPNKSQIRSIRISRDQFAAEFHAAGGINVEIITQPGMGPMRMNVELSPARRFVERPQPVRAGARAGRQSQSRHRRRRHADQEQELVQLLHQRRRTAARRRTSTSSRPTASTAPKRWRSRATTTASTAT